MMFWLWLFVVVLFFIAGYLLVAPISLQLSTSRRLFRVRLFYLASARLRITDDSLLADIRAVGWKKTFNLLERQERRAKKNGKRRSKVRKPSLKKILAVLRSFRVKGLVNVDTGSMPVNGMLFPVVHLLRNRTGWPVFINFRDQLIVELEIRNSVARMAWAYVSS